MYALFISCICICIYVSQLILEINIYLSIKKARDRFTENPSWLYMIYQRSYSRIIYHKLAVQSLSYLRKSTAFTQKQLAHTMHRSSNGRSEKTVQINSGLILL